MKKTWYVLLQFELFLIGFVLIFIDYISVVLIGYEMAAEFKKLGIFPVLSAGGYCFMALGLFSFLPAVERYLRSNRISSYLIPAHFMSILALMTMEVILHIAVFTEPIFRINTNWFGELPAQNTSFYWASEGFSITKYDGLPGEIHTPYTGGKKVVVLGDSFMEGLLTHDRQKIASVLETTLRQEGDLFDVHNLGRSGHSIADYAVNIPKYIHMYDPEVIAILLGESDFIEAMDSSRDNHFTRDDAGRLKTVSKYVSVEEPLIVSEPFFTLRPMLIVSGYNRFSQMKQLALKASRIEEAPYQGMDVELGKEQLNALVDASDGIPLILISYPYISFVDGNEIVFRAEAYEKFNAAMTPQTGFHYIDSVPHFRQYIKSGLLPVGFINGSTFAWGHLNAFGNEVIASLLADEIKRVVE